MMVSIKRGFFYLFNNQSQFADSIVKNFLRWLPDKWYLALRYRFQMGYFINFKSPRTFTEKLQWLKLYDRNPAYSIMVDKYAVKQYVKSRIGDQYIIPTSGLWNTVEEINWDLLPDQFVIKTTHGGGGGGVIICTDKKTFDKDKAIDKLNGSLIADIYAELREWPYKNVPKRIIAEKFMSSSIRTEPCGLTDYKFYCFNGEPKYCQVIRDRHTCETIDFYDMDWQHQEFVGLNPQVENGKIPVPCPLKLESMINICRKLSEGIPFLRVDLYVIDDEIYFGELTFYPASGIGQFKPIKWQNILGDLIELPVKKK